MLTLLLILWASFTALLIVLLIYRSTLTMHEDDQLFLDDRDAHIQSEQMEVLSRVGKLVPVLRLSAVCSVLLMLAIGAELIHRWLKH